MLVCFLARSQESSRNDSIHKLLILPNNIAECFTYLDIILEPEYKNDSSVFSFWHFGTGLWIRNNWVRNNQKLWNYFKNHGFHEPDGISGIIGTGYEKWLNGSITDPEAWIDKKKRENDSYVLFVDGMKYYAKDSILRTIEPASVHRIYIRKYPTQFYNTLEIESPFIVIGTINGYEKFDNSLKRNLKGYKNIRKKYEIRDLNFLYDSDTLLFIDIIGRQNNLIFSIPDKQNKYITVKFINN